MTRDLFISHLSEPCRRHRSDEDSEPPEQMHCVPLREGIQVAGERGQGLILIFLAKKEMMCMLLQGEDVPRGAKSVQMENSTGGVAINRHVGRRELPRILLPL